VTLIDEACAKVLPIGRDTTAETDVFSIRCLGGLFQRSVNAGRDTMEGSDALFFSHPVKRPWSKNPSFN